MNEQPPYRKWREPGVPTTRFLLDFYDACLREPSPQKVALALGSSQKEVYSWLRRSPQLQEAQDLAGERRGTRANFQGYIFQHLSQEAQETWNQIKFWENVPSTYERVEKIFKGKNIRLRQELFVHALVSSNFDVSSACKMVGVNRMMLRDWQENDAAFRGLVEEIQWHKKNFFEKQLISLVEEKHPGAVMFVNRTVNRDRGYTEKLEVEHTGANAGLIDIESLKLDQETRRKILDAVREQRALKASEEARPVRGEVIEVPQLVDVGGEVTTPVSD